MPRNVCDFNFEYLIGQMLVKKDWAKCCKAYQERNQRISKLSL